MATERKKRFYFFIANWSRGEKIWCSFSVLRSNCESIAISLSRSIWMPERCDDVGDEIKTSMRQRENEKEAPTHNMYLHLELKNLNRQREAEKNELSDATKSALSFDANLFSRRWARKIHWAGTMIRFYSLCVCESTLTSAGKFIDSLNNTASELEERTIGSKVGGLTRAKPKASKKEETKFTKNLLNY